MSDKPQAPKPEDIGGTGSVSAGSPQRPPERTPWGTKDSSEPAGQTPTGEDPLGNAKVGGPGPGSGA